MKGLQVTKKVRSYEKGTKRELSYKKGTKLRKGYEITKRYEVTKKVRSGYEKIYERPWL